MSKSLLLISLLAASTWPSHLIAQGQPPAATDLLDPDLSRWEVFMGVPHASVTGLPPGTFQAENVHDGIPLGLNNDPKKVFSTMLDEGVTVLRISGEIYGCITTKDEFADYHFRTEFKWGEQKWAPRLTAKRDSGILYHCHGDHGAFWKVWKSSLEFQVQETDLGDFYQLAGTGCHTRFRTEGDLRLFDPSVPWMRADKHVHAVLEPDKPHGEWNVLEVYAFGDSAIHVVNGVVVFALKNATGKDKKSLRSGQIQIQSEGAECYYRNMRLSPISAFPESLAKQAGLGTSAG